MFLVGLSFSLCLYGVADLELRSARRCPWAFDFGPDGWNVASGRLRTTFDLGTERASGFRNARPAHQSSEQPSGLRARQSEWLAAGRGCYVCNRLNRNVTSASLGDLRSTALRGGEKLSIFVWREIIVAIVLVTGPLFPLYSSSRGLIDFGFWLYRMLWPRRGRIDPSDGNRRAAETR